MRIVKNIEINKWNKRIKNKGFYSIMGIKKDKNMCWINIIIKFIINIYIALIS